MKTKSILVFTIFTGSFLAATFVLANNHSISQRLSGRILLQVQEKGEAWYVSPKNQERIYLRNGADAFDLMRANGIGISNHNLSLIPVGNFNLNSGVDSDNDGLSDAIEDALGTDKNKADTDGDGFDDRTEILNGHNPLGSGKMTYNLELAKKFAGQIFLQVERNGEAWYINPVDNRRYFLGRPDDAYNLMRGLGLGITNLDLEKIIINKSSNQPPRSTDKILQRPSLSLAEAKAVAEKYVNDNLMQEGATATVTNISEENGLYKLIVDTKTDVVISYLAKGGNYFFPSSLDVESILKDRIIPNRELSLEEAREISQELIDNYLTVPTSKYDIVRIYEEPHAIDNNLYKLEVDQGGANPIHSFITKNGKLFFPQAFKVE